MINYNYTKQDELLMNQLEEYIEQNFSKETNYILNFEVWDSKFIETIPENFELIFPAVFYFEYILNSWTKLELEKRLRNDLFPTFLEYQATIK